jgi:hypothetical protein
MNASLRLLAVCLISALLLLFTACAGAMRIATRQRGSNGQQFSGKTFDPSVVQPGTTTREEIFAKFSMINTGYNDPHLFWGRWATSKWGYWWIVVAPSTNGGGGAGAGDAHRIWQIHNMLITFDDNGVVSGKQLLDDDSQLWRELTRHAATLPPTDASEIISLHGQPQITLASEWVQAVRTGRKTSAVRVAPDKIVRIAHTAPNDKSNSPGTSCHVLYLSEKTPFGKKLRFCSEGPALIATFRYLHRYAAPNMQWE